MSSAVYEAELAPDERIRAGLLAFACCVTLAGLILILLLPVIAPLRAALGATFLLAAIVEAITFMRGMSRIYRIRIRSDGSISGVGSAGTMQPLTLLPGSIVLDRLAWLRLQIGRAHV